MEKTGKWPDTLPGPLGILLPKGGSDEPLDRRPIWLMPMIYRIWATRRARDWAYWRICWEREGDFQGADALAWDVALASEAASSQGLTFGIVALDWKKGYDGVSLEILANTLAKAQIPEWALNPLMDMYTKNDASEWGK